MKAYQFLSADLTLPGSNEGSWKVGETRTWSGKGGYYSHPNWYSALDYANGPIACVVDIPTLISKNRDKLISKTCTLLAFEDATEALQTFTNACVDRALTLSKIDDERVKKAAEVRRKWARRDPTVWNADLVMEVVQLHNIMHRSDTATRPILSILLQSMGWGSTGIESDEKIARNVMRAYLKAFKGNRMERRWVHARLGQLISSLFPLPPAKLSLPKTEMKIHTPIHSSVCGRCGYAVETADPYCETCGAELTWQGCMYCNHIPKNQTATFCSRCGRKLEPVKPKRSPKRDEGRWLTPADARKQLSTERC